jgi:DNA-binding MarR family transcriptional regulator
MMNPFEELLKALFHVHEQSIHALRPKGEEGLSHGHMFLLFQIYRSGSIKTTDIAHHFGITSGAATGIADKLENLGFISRERDKRDRRVVIISLSDKGVAFIEEQKRANVKLYKELLKDFSSEEIQGITDSLNKMAETIKNRTKE